VRATGLASYPDVSVVYGPPLPDPDSPESVTNPSVLVEVLSDSTLEYDLGEKFEHYRQIPQAVVYLWQAERRIEVRRRQPGGVWASVDARSGDVARLEALGCDLVVDDLYRDATPPS
jgi:Uma2 family endonuclease